jgi:tRNA threonylcarbamoyladenosine modification (KEOPS) complex Cgi121 subunit
LQFFFEDYGFYVEIAGLRGVPFELADAYLKANRRVNQQTVWIQFFNATVIATREHLYFAVLNALSAFRSHINLSKSLAMETLLYASAQRQIQKAIQAVGIKPGISEVAVVIIGERAETVQAALKDVTSNLRAVPCDAVLDLTPQKSVQIQQVFNITASMLESAAANGKGADSALVDLVVEQVALLATQL